MVISGPGKLTLSFEPTDGSPKQEFTVFNFKGPGVALSMYNIDEVRISILNNVFARFV